MANPLQRASRRSRDRRQNTRAAYATSSGIRLAGDRRMTPSPQGEGFGESQPACVPPEAGQGAGLCARREGRWIIAASRGPHPALRATFPVRGEGFGESQPACVPAQAGQEGGTGTDRTPHPSSASRGSADATFSSRRRLWRIPTSVRPGGGGTGGRIPEQLMTPHPSSASREIGGCHLPLKGKAWANPLQRASRRRRDRRLDH